jgi:hypothetical protein
MSSPKLPPFLPAASLLVLSLAAGCHDLSSYSTDTSEQYVGCVIPASFVLAGVSPATQLCLTLDGSHLEDAPGTISSSDGRFQSTPLRPIPQLWSDSLSTFTFGEGHTKDLLYMATPRADAGVPGDVTVVVSLMVGRSVEVRLLRGAPPVASADGSAPPAASNIFAVFPLTLQQGGCASLSAVHCTPDAQ